MDEHKALNTGTFDSEEDAADAWWGGAGLPDQTQVETTGN